MVVELCSLLTNMEENSRDTIIYNAKDKRARALADWWEEHQKTDLERIAKEKIEVEEKAMAEKAKSKLSAAELAALRNHL